MKKKSLKGTKTIENLMKSFAGESQARNRYTMFASIAAKEGYTQIEHIFLETADNERIHAKEFYNLIAASLDTNETTILPVEATYPVTLGDTLTNLRAAAAGEREEYAELYNHFADVADDEGFPDVAFKFRKIASIEEEHERRYLKLASSLEEGKFFRKDTPVSWKCTKCGYIHKGDCPPKVCPVCNHPQGYFVVEVANY